MAVPEKRASGRLGSVGIVRRARQTESNVRGTARRWLWIGLFSGTYIVAMTLVGERFRGADLVTANASFGLLWGLGILVGPLLSGTAMDIWDPNGFPGTLAGATLLVLAIALFRRWQTRGR